MNILVTGSNGFIGKNLIATLALNDNNVLFCYDHDNSLEAFDDMVKKADIVFHLAGVNRPINVDEYKSGNVDLSEYLVQKLQMYKNTCPVVFTSSIQASQDNPYGISKREAENILIKHHHISSSPVYIFRLPNVFGKWSRPNYNSAVATFCHSVARNLPITINNADTVVRLIYIDDVVNAFTKCFDFNQNGILTPEVSPVYEISVGDLAQTIKSFKEERGSFVLPQISEDLVKKLYSTYLSFLPLEDFSYSLDMKKDNRGSFTEFIRTNSSGQFSINIAKPGIVKGNHWHHTKHEKFLVVSGEAIIRFKHVMSQGYIEYRVSSNDLTVVDIPPGYAHNIENVGTNDLVTVMWANEAFDLENPDTHYFEVKNETH